MKVPVKPRNGEARVRSLLCVCVCVCTSVGESYTCAVPHGYCLGNFRGTC